MRILDGVALVLAVLFSLLLVCVAGLYTGTEAEILRGPVLSSERRDAVVATQRHLIKDGVAHAADIVTAETVPDEPDEIRVKPLALLILLLKEGRGAR